MKDVSVILYSVADTARAKRFFGALLGAEPYVDSPMYIGYKYGEMEIGLVPGGTESTTGGIAYWTVDDIAASVKALVDAGGTVIKEPADVGYGLLVASVKDPNGSTVGLRQPPKG